METVVIYKSRTGFTRKYAEWISEELKCKMIDYNNISKYDLNNFDIVIYGGRVHAGKIDSLGNIKKIVQNKKCQLIVFATGATPITAIKEIEEMIKNNFSDDSIPHFYMQSGLCYEKMGFADKTIMKMLYKMLSSKQDKTGTESGALNVISNSYDISDKKYIEPLISYIVENYEIKKRDV